MTSKDNGSGQEAEFDRLSGSYEELLRDPIRDRFTGDASQFFHERKRDLIREYFRRLGTDTRRLSYLDIGCGKGELLTLLRGDFADVSGCDPSSGMLEAGGLESLGVKVRIQPDGEALPFEPAQFDFVTAVCVYHHVKPQSRAGLTMEVRRVLRPGGIFAIIEHNPYNPATRLIVSRTPVDADAILLPPSESRTLLRDAGFQINALQFFLYFPKTIYGRIGRLESALRSIPLGGQYAAFARSR